MASIAMLTANTVRRRIGSPAADGAGAGAVPGAGAVLGALAGEAAETLDAATVLVRFVVLLVLVTTPAGTDIIRKGRSVSHKPGHWTMEQSVHLAYAPGSLYGQATTAAEPFVTFAVELVKRLVVTGLQIMARPLNAGTVVVFTCTLTRLELAVLAHYRLAVGQATSADCHVHMQKTTTLRLVRAVVLRVQRRG